MVVEARTQDPTQLDAWKAALSSADAAERAAAAFALGQLGVAWDPPSDDDRARAEATLLAALAVEKDAAVRDRVVEALGKVGGKLALASLTQALDGAERARAAIALAALAKSRSLTDDRSRVLLEKQLGDGDADARYGAALALQRYKDPGSRPALLKALSDSAVHVRATAAKALADAGRPEDAGALAPLVDDADVRVAAEAARTLVKLAGKCKDSCAPVEALRKAKLPWRPSVVQAVTFEHWRGAAAVVLLRQAYDAATHDGTLEPRGKAIVACKLAMSHDRALRRIDLLRSCGRRLIDERQRSVWMAQAIGDGGDAPLTARLSAELAKLASSRHAAVRGAVAEAADPATTRKLLGDGDSAVVAAAAERATKLKLADAGPLMQAALGRLRGADAVEAQQAILAAAAELKLAAFIPAARALVDADPYALRQAAAQALTALEGRPVVARLPAVTTASSTPAPATVRIKTTRGTIRARLWTEDAPRTSENFLALVKRGFYDKLTFHRVVPNFVSQGGDPRGDGSGGPGYMIPCEINMRRYGEGVLGMALSGRDTGGSQLFFTHSPQPHLDGRYTSFGEVIEGLDVAVRLIEGDVILEARVE
ncbi:MAG: peptidylprolyl isomerase [Myxococcales bacterium]|nr:peptidylprolyl isomerase [Myxococcales bacterium]